jgi:hypothetical protein
MIQSLRENSKVTCKYLGHFMRSADFGIQGGPGPNPLHIPRDSYMLGFGGFFAISNIELRFSQYKILHLEVFNVEDLHSFHMLCSHHHYLIPEHSITPKRKTILVSTHFHSWKPLIHFLPLWTCLFCTYYTNGITQSVALCVCLASFTLANVFKIHLCYSMYQCFFWW